MYQREAVTDVLFASTKLEECSDKNKKNQEFDIKYGGCSKLWLADLDIPDYSEQSKDIRDTLYLKKGNFIMKDD